MLGFDCRTGCTIDALALWIMGKMAGTQERAFRLEQHARSLRTVSSHGVTRHLRAGGIDGFLAPT